MGCAQIIPARSRKGSKSSSLTIESLDSNEVRYAKIKQRDGHPSFYKTDGYEFGLRVKVRSNLQTYYVGTARTNGEKVTIKEYNISNCEESSIVEELIIMSQLVHESLPKLAEIFITNTSVYAITDYIDNMRLSAFLDVKSKKTTTLTIPDTRKIIRSITSAVNFCHENKIIIRNITLNNIMVKKVGKESFEVKIADFAQAVEFGSNKVLYDHPLFDWAEVPYCAPEALLGHPYTCSMDVWSIGVLLFAMLSGELPFDSDDDKELVDKIKHASFDFKEDNTLWQYVNNDIKDVIKQMIVVPATERITCKQFLKSQWIVVG